MPETTTLLHYRISGDGDPVVFLHGFMEDLTMWDNIMQAFPDKTCICIDLHGHGQSFFNPEITPSVAVMAQQVQAVLRHLGIKDYQLVGHSMGGYVGCHLLQTDDLLEHLILLHSHPWADSDSKKQDRNRVIDLVKTKAAFFIRESIPNLFAFPDQQKETILHYCSIAEKMSPGAIGWAAAAMRDRSAYTGILETHPEAVSIIQGQLDPLIPNLQLRTFAEKHAIGFHEIQQCGHMGHEEQPQAVTEWLRVLIA